MGRLESYQFNQIMDDKRVWKAHVSGVFSCKSFLESLLDSNEEPKFPHFDFIWKSSVPTRLRSSIGLQYLAKLIRLIGYKIEDLICPSLLRGVFFVRKLANLQIIFFFIVNSLAGFGPRLLFVLVLKGLFPVHGLILLVSVGF
ncbi:hypothetical protein LguiB_001653 [Lonicera macranthoides]